MRSIARTHRLVCAAAFAALLVAASCGGNGGGETVVSTTTAVSTTTSGTPSSPTARELSKLLLTAAETGDGWTELGTTAPELGLALCDKASQADLATLRKLITDRYGVQRVFRSEKSSPGDGPLKLVELIFRSDRAPEGFDALQRVFDACRGQSWTELNKPTHLEPMAAPDLGDRTGAYVITSTEPATASTPELTTRGPVVVVLVGDVLMSLHSVDIQKTGSEPRLSDAQLSEIVVRAVNKVKAHG
jgi:hypothetical protein